MIIKVHPKLNHELWLAIKAAKAKNVQSFMYKGVELHCDKPGDRHYHVRLTGLSQKLPAAFQQARLEAHAVELLDKLSKNTRLLPGLYSGKLFGFGELYYCSVHFKPEPKIYVTGLGLNKVIAFYKKVMTGKLKPTLPADE